MIAFLNFFLLVFVSIPVAVYKNNAFDYPFSFVEVVPVCLTIFFAMSVLSYFLFKIVKFKIIYSYIVFILTVIVWTQANVFQWNYGALEDGDWYQKWYYGIADSSFIFIAILFFYLFREQAHKYVNKKVGLWIFAFISLTTVINIFLIPREKMKNRLVIDTAEFFSFSKDKNVIVLLIDEAQSSSFREVLESDDTARQKFSGFNFFLDTSSNTKSTSLSLPMILLGSYFDNSQSFEDFFVKGLTESSLPKDFIDQGYRVDLSLSSVYFSNSDISRKFVSSVKSVEFEIMNSAAVFDMTLFISLPHFAKIFAYNDHQWFFRRFEKQLRLINSLVNSQKGNEKKSFAPPAGIGDDDTRFFQEAEGTGVVNSEEKVFKFFHLNGAHSPFNIDSSGRQISKKAPEATYLNKLRYKIGLIGGFLDHLKALGVYEESTIVLLSDHGCGKDVATTMIEDPVTGLVNILDFNQARANSFLMIKEAGQISGFKYQSKPIETIDIRSMIGQLTTGKSLELILKEYPDNRIRRFFTYPWNQFRPFAKDYSENIIDGPAYKQSSFFYFHNHEHPFKKEQCFLARYSDTKKMVSGQIEEIDELRILVRVQTSIYTSSPQKVVLIVENNIKDVEVKLTVPKVSKEFLVSEGVSEIEIDLDPSQGVNTTIEIHSSHGFGKNLKVAKAVFF